MNQLTSVTSELLKRVPTRKAARFPSTLICFSHLRWDFVYQRPQHLMKRFAQDSVVFFMEEPIYDASFPHYIIDEKSPTLHVVVPHLPGGTSPEDAEDMLRELLDGFMATHPEKNTAFWYYTPMALAFSDHYKPVITIFDCMDELSAFKFAPPRLKQMEQDLLSRADVVFTGGMSLYEAKKSRHDNIYAFPSSIDFAHFSQARNGVAEPADQLAIPGPRFGFYGVVDERFDIELLREAAALKPDWHFIIVGPVVKIDPASLPQAANIHYIGGRTYTQLPAYLKGWDVAMILFALNESTRFISPTKTPEYLAGGKPVISTPIHDVVYPYGEESLVHIVSNAQEFITAGEKILSEKDSGQWLRRVDTFLRGNSWDQTYLSMKSLAINTLSQAN